MNEPGPDAMPSDLSRSSPQKAPGASKRPLARIVKRGIDIVVSATSIFLLLPLMILVAGTILAMDRSSPLVREACLGGGGRRFECLRFRTTEREGFAVVGKPSILTTPTTPRRVTSLGRVLIATSLDELPMLVNVLRGEMSLVGPRPIPSDSPQGSHTALAMPPGLTGIWQLEGSHDANEADRAALNLDYARRWTLGRDFVILLRSVADAFARRHGG